MPTSCSRRQSSRLALALALTFTLAAAAWPSPQRAAGPQILSTATGAAAEVPAKTDAAIEQRTREAYGKLGVSFEENRGQVDSRVRFLSRRGGATVFLTNDEAAFVLSGPKSRDKAADERSPREELTPERSKSHTVRMKFEGANPRAEASGERELEGKVNYFRGGDPSKWRTNVKTYGAVRYRGIYDGVDLVYYGNERGEMEYDFVVAPGADPRQISLKVEGAKAVKLDAAGDLVLSTPAGPLKQRRPTVYQEVGGARREVAGGYAVEPGGRVRFKLGEYDRSAPLVIDPVMSYWLIGETDYDEAFGVAADSSGNFYVTGYSELGSSPGSGTREAFVAKFTPGGSFSYFTYLGSFDTETFHERASGLGIAADPAGNAYVTGYTTPGFPLVNAFQSAYGGGSTDAFVAKISPDGSALVYSTYLGGSAADQGNRIALDSTGNAYVAGSTTSTDFPTANALQGTHSPNSSDAFVTKFNAAGSALVYSTYLDGGKYSRVSGVAADSGGNAYLAGLTSATDFPVVNALQGANAGGFDAFVTRLKPDGSGLVFSTYLGGSGTDSSSGIGVDSWGHATIGGLTQSADFPLKNPLPGADAGVVDVYAARIKANGTALLYSTYVGTENEDFIRDVTADPSGNAYLAGQGIDPEFESFETETPYVGLLIKINSAPVIRGRVVTPGADGPVGVPSVTVNLSGSQTISKLTDAQGYYAFTGLAQGGDYTVTPSKTGLSFIPPSRTYTNLFADVPNANFITPSLLVNNAAVTEGNAGEVSATFTVTLKPASTQPVTVNYQTIDGATNTAASGTDYMPLPLTQLTFAPGETAKAVVVKVKGDTLDEANETFRLLLSEPATALIFKAEGVCVITDDDPTPSLSVNNVAVTEGDADVTATFTVTLSAASGRTVKVKYQTVNGTATAPADYTAAAPATLTFAPGETTKTVAVTIKGDALDEPAETFKLLLSSPANATVAAGAGTCTITDDD